MDIKEELGVDIDIVMKALSNGFYIKEIEMKITNCSLKKNHKNGKWYLINEYYRIDPYLFATDNYGITWFLERK